MKHLTGFEPTTLVATSDKLDTIAPFKIDEVSDIDDRIIQRGTRHKASF